MLKTHYAAMLGCFVLLFAGCTEQNRYDLAKYGLTPDTRENSSPLMAKAIQAVSERANPDQAVIITLPKGRYDFYPEGAGQHEYYISNHDQDNPKTVGLAFERLKNVTFDGQGSELVFHGRMLPVSLVNAENCTLKNFSIDFENPHISQVEILENDTLNGIITYEVAPWVDYEVRDSNFVAKGEGWEHTSRSGIAFEGDTKRLVYRTSDISVGTKKVDEIAPRILRAPWNNKRLIPGTVVVLRGHGRPTPGIFMTYSTNTTLENIQVHYAEGMGLLAQMCEDIALYEFSVALKGDDDPRYFTTQADATHFSGCKGKITSVGGLYEGMMDDAINVHGTYLKVKERVDDHTLIGEYMHSQSYGFEWGYAGDEVLFIESRTMEIVGENNTIQSIQAVDQSTAHGAKQFKLVFEAPVPATVGVDGIFGIENLTWTPEVYFARNTVRNNRARGTLFSTPKKVLVEENYFDHTSGTAILLCGDCNGWFETGACHDVVIRKNRFVNSLTNMFQFTNAIISIYPEIPDLGAQKQYFHSNIIIEENEFETFDAPIVYAKSVDGLIIKRNVIKSSNEYPAFHWNDKRFLLEHVTNDQIEDNTFEGGFDPAKDIKRTHE